ncbi:MAG: sugar phosphate isomerase/epimerase family protein [Verrucomicrobiota bacterium]
MRSQISRRNFFKTSALASAALAGIGLLENFSRAIEPFHRSGRPRFPLSIAAYSFRDFFKTKDAAKQIDLFKFINFCAEQGCQGTELTSYYFPTPVTTDYLLKIKRHCFLRGIEISGTAAGNNFALPKGEELIEQINGVKKWIDHAAIMGAPHIRVFAGKAADGLSDAEARKMCIGSLEEVCDYAGTKGIFLGLENHGGIVAEAVGILEIIKAVKSPWLGINLDTGNFHTADPYADLIKIAPYAVNVQMKAAMRTEDEKVPKPADLKRLFQILRDANYQGYVALEFEKKGDPWVEVPILLKQMKELAA